MAAKRRKIDDNGPADGKTLTSSKQFSWKYFGDQKDEKNEIQTVRHGDIVEADIVIIDGTTNCVKRFVFHHKEGGFIVGHLITPSGRRMDLKKTAGHVRVCHASAPTQEPVSSATTETAVEKSNEIPKKSGSSTCFHFHRRAHTRAHTHTHTSHHITSKHSTTPHSPLCHQHTSIATEIICWWNQGKKNTNTQEDGKKAHQKIHTHPTLQITGLKIALQ